MTDEQIALIAKALSHPARVRIVGLLAAQTECRGHEVFSELPLAQSTVSEHLRVLKEAGLVTSTPVGTATVYCLAAPTVQGFRDALGLLAEGAVTCSAEKKGR